MTSAFNTAMNGLFDLLVLPFSWFPPIVGLSVLSAAFGVLLLLMFKYTSPQKAIARVKDRLWASMHEIRLYQDDLGVLSRAITRLARDNGLYLASCSVALVPLVLVVLPILFQLDARYGFAPLEKGEKFVLNVALAKGQDPVEDHISLELPEGLLLDAGPVRVPSRNELAYRITVDEPGEYEVNLMVNGTKFTKKVAARPGETPISPGRYSSAKTLDALMFPVEKPWPGDSRVQAIFLSQNRASMLGIDGDLWPWLWVFCIVGLAFGYAFKGVFNVKM